MTRKKPWNRTNLPVYSISSKGSGGNENMNIITYVTAVSMKPKRFICGVYENTKTLENVLSYPDFILQLLSENQYSLVALLGRKSGHTIDKISTLEKRKAVTEWQQFKILSGCLAVMQMKIIDKIEGGDHTAILCEVDAYKNIQEGSPLTLDILRKRKLIRI